MSFSLKDSILFSPASMSSIVSFLAHASEKTCQSALCNFHDSRASRSALKADRISFSFYFSAPENALFLYFGVLFFDRKRHPHFRFFSLFGTKMAVTKNEKKENQNFGWANARRVELFSHLQSHTAAVHIATRTGSKHWADSVCCLCCCSRLVSIAPPARKFLSAPPTSVVTNNYSVPLDRFILIVEVVC